MRLLFIPLEDFSKAKNGEKFCLSGVFTMDSVFLSHPLTLRLRHSLSFSMPPFNNHSFCCRHQTVYGAYLRDASRSRSHGGCVIFGKTLAWLGAELSWHLDWQDCKRTGREGEVMPFSLLRPLSSLLSRSLCSLLNTLQ